MPVGSKDVKRLIKTVSMLRRLWVLAFLVGLYSVIPVLKEYTDYKSYIDVPASVFTIFSLVLSVVLVFRTNRAYDRWWEARTLWGKLVNISRNLAIKVSTLGNLTPPERAELHREIVGFAFALKDHLREGAKLATLPGWKEATESPSHVPAWFMYRLYARLAGWQREGRLSGESLRIIDQEALEFLNVCGGCERIRNTLIAGSYRSFALKSLILYLLILPWGLAHDLKWLAVPVCMVFSYMMVGLEVIADNVEEPFGYDLDDLNLERLCLAIDVSTAEILSVSSLTTAT